MVVGDTALVELLPFLKKAEAKLGREVNPTVYDAGEFRQKAKSSGHLIARVLERPRIMIIGTDDALEKLAGKPLDRGA